MSIRARKSDYNEDWHIEREFPCINGLSAWFVVATAEEADEASMGYTDGAFGTAEERANSIAAGLQHTCSVSEQSEARRSQHDSFFHVTQDEKDLCEVCERQRLSGDVAQPVRVPDAWIVDGPMPFDSSEVFLTHEKALEAFNEWGKRITPLYKVANALSAKPPAAPVETELDDLREENKRLHKRIETVITERLNVEFAFAMDQKRQVEKENEELKTRLQPSSAVTEYDLIQAIVGLDNSATSIARMLLQKFDVRQK